MATVITEPPPGFLRSRVGGLPRPFWVLWAGTLINRLGTMVEPFLGYYLVGVRGLSVVATGLVMAVFGAGSIVSQFVGGALTDTVGRRATLTGGMLANAAAMIALGYVEPTWAIVTVAFLLGLTIDMYRPASQSLVADLIPAAERTRAYGLIFWAVNLGFAVAMVTGGTLARAGFIWLFWADAITCAVFGLLVWRMVPETRVRREPGEKPPGGFRVVLRDRLMVLYSLTMLGHMVVYLQAFTTLPIAMNEQGLPPRSYGIAMAVNGIAIVVIQPLVSGWLGRRDHSLVIAGGNLAVGIGFGLFSWVASTVAYSGAVFVWTLGEIAVAAVGAAIVAQLAPAELRGRYMGLFGSAWSVGVLLAPLTGTRLLEYGAPALWLSCAGLAVAASAGQLVLAPAVRRRVSVPAGQDL